MMLSHRLKHARHILAVKIMILIIFGLFPRIITTVSYNLTSQAVYNYVDNILTETN